MNSRKLLTLAKLDLPWISGKDL